VVPVAAIVAVAAATAVVAAAATVTMFALVAVTFVVAAVAFAMFTRRAILVEAGAASQAPAVAARKRQGASGAQREKPDRNQCCDA